MAYSVLVTGGAGFVGSNLAMGLSAKHADWEIVALDNLSRQGSELNRDRLIAAGIACERGDVRHMPDLSESMANPDLIVDCAADPSVVAGFEDPESTLRTNLLGTINTLELARVTRADVIFLSTSRVYPVEHLQQLEYTEGRTRFELAPDQQISGISEKGVSEDFPIQGTRTIYGASKLASELLVAEYGEAFGLRTLINRCGILAGPWQMGKVDQGVFALWVARHFYNRPLRYIGFGGLGKQVRDLLHIDDFVELIDVQIGMLDDLAGETFNVGGGVERSASLLEVTDMCRWLTGNQPPISSVQEPAKGDIPIYISDNTCVEKATGWVPSRGVETTLEGILKWLSENESLKGIVG